MSLYTAPSQIVQRQLDYFSDKHVLVAGEVEDLFPVELEQHCRKVSLFTTHFGYYESLSGYPQIDATFGAQISAPCDADILLLYWPKAKQEALYLLNMLLATLGAGTEVIVVGENRSGIKSIEKMFSPFGRMQKYDSARRCSFYVGECESAPNRFNIDEWFKSYQVDTGEISLTIKSLPGVFSHGELDLGTRLLLDSLPDLSGKVLDFGCGAGVIGSVMKIRYPDIELALCDVSALAVESTKATLAANNIEGQAFASNVYSRVEGQYNAIVSNPPFHSGLETNYDATETLLKQAPEYLEKQGTLCIVANRFLKYPPIIEQVFGHCEANAKTGKFSIYQATK